MSERVPITVDQFNILTPCLTHGNLPYEQLCDHTLREKEYIQCLLSCNLDVFATEETINSSHKSCCNVQSKSKLQSQRGRIAVSLFVYLMFQSCRYEIARDVDMECYIPNYKEKKEQEDLLKGNLCAESLTIYSKLSGLNFTNKI